MMRISGVTAIKATCFKYLAHSYRLTDAAVTNEGCSGAVERPHGTPSGSFQSGCTCGSKSSGGGTATILTVGLQLFTHRHPCPPPTQRSHAPGSRGQGGERERRSGSRKSLMLRCAPFPVHAPLCLPVTCAPPPLPTPRSRLNQRRSSSHEHSDFAARRARL